jgi:hypothetical protein
VEAKRLKEDATTIPSRSASRSSSKSTSQNAKKFNSRNAGRREKLNAEPDQSAIATSTAIPSDTRSVFPPTPLYSDKDANHLASPNTPKDALLNPSSNVRLTLNGVVERLPEPLPRTTRT